MRARGGPRCPACGDPVPFGVVTGARHSLFTCSGCEAHLRWLDDHAEETDGKRKPERKSFYEGIAATLVLPMPGAVKAWALDERGQRKSEIAVKTAEGRNVIEIGPESKTLWYEIEATDGAFPKPENLKATLQESKSVPGRQSPHS